MGRLSNIHACTRATGRVDKVRTASARQSLSKLLARMPTIVRKNATTRIPREMISSYHVTS